MATTSRKSCVPDLAEYGLTRERGFLPAQDPLKSLPPAYRAWDHAVQEVSHYILAGVVRPHLERLPLLPVSGLKDGPELQRAYSVLSLLCHSYVWGEGEARACSVLPRNLAVPWAEVSKRLGIPPVLTHAAVVLWNWRRLDSEGPLDLSNLACLGVTAGGLDEAWFYLVTVEIEAKGAKALCAIVDAMAAAEEGRPEAVARHMDELSVALANMGVSLRRMYEKCDPHMFFNKIRLYLSGWKNNPALPNGLIYEGVSKTPLQYSGGSAAQSSCIQAIDIALGVDHHPMPKQQEEVKACPASVKAEPGTSCPMTGQKAPTRLTGCPVKTAGDEYSYLHEMRQYMPGKDRAFLEALEGVPSLRSYVLSNEAKCETLRPAYNGALDALAAFRSIHIQVCVWVG
eukprot:comp20814_c0_seq2/m.27425 comp20814_c0_seq2/g.27425  ORF comp20814_c0_seq2/g.27425 comp20814_c0_seq2/m.27425 type:complete len:399 (-) comp20814_c0_seq2:222-1418(-)